MGTATHKLYDLLESVFGPDIHLGPTQDTDLQEEDDRADEQEEELPEGATTGLAEPNTAPFPEAS